MARRTPVLLSAEDLYRLPDDDLQHELVRGRLVSEPLPDARHGRVCSNVNFVLQSWARDAGAGVVYTCDTGFVLERGPDTVRGPDVAFVSAARLQPDDSGKFHEGPPDLAMEVLSPGNRPGAMAAKVNQYLASGARHVWIVDPAAETLSEHCADQAHAFGLGDTFTGSGLLEGLRFAVRELFALPTFAATRKTD